MSKAARVEDNSGAFDYQADGPSSQDSLDYAQLQEQLTVIPREAVLQPAESVHVSLEFDATTIAIFAGSALLASLAAVVLFKAIRKRRRGW
ncbi:hypothetical protein [Cohnella fermenti]|uniref:Uncharacterized protein n=1 Tax=Cohnella fermenti TaxID=2565925 RepID=A0A4S4BHM3_9BACL|nr:hypothetical protein [Cohnella fermenti]THF73935.1 hypothetical protein E6C55_27075 [Cohnella fermenti]